VERSVVTKHLANIYNEHELVKEATCAKIAQVQTEGNRNVNRKIQYYNLYAIISVGYRINSNRATLFRIWATERLKEYIIKGFTMDDERLKNLTIYLGKIILRNNLQEYVIFVPVKDGYIKKLRIFIANAARIIELIVKLQTRGRGCCQPKP